MNTHTEHKTVTSIDIMYQEDIYSKNNMRINAYYLKESKHLRQKYKVPLYFKNCLVRFVKIWLHLTHIKSYGVKKTFLNIWTEINPSFITDYEVDTGFDENLEFNYQSERSITGKIAVYTAIFGDYDPIKEPLYISSKCDYYAITDQKISPKSVWKKKEVNLDAFNSLDNYHKSKFCKLHPHILFPDYDFSIWVDGNVQIVADMYPLIDRMNACMASYMNPIHDCIYTEAKFLIYCNAVHNDEIKRQIDKYKQEGFPKHFGMREFTIIARKHNDAELIGFMEQWWNEVNEHTMRDQISFPYILWKNNKTIDYIELLGKCWRYNPRFISHRHTWRITYAR